LQSHLDFHFFSGLLSIRGFLIRLSGSGELRP
jgi:hypothetical protein